MEPHELELATRCSCCDESNRVWRCKILASYGLFVDNDGLPSCVRWICPTMSTNSMRVPSMPLQDHWSILCCTKSSDFLRPRICVPLIIFPSSHRLRLPDYIHLSHLHSSNLLVKYGSTMCILKTQSFQSGWCGWSNRDRKGYTKSGRYPCVLEC